VAHVTAFSAPEAALGINTLLRHELDPAWRGVNYAALTTRHGYCINPGRHLATEVLHGEPSRGHVTAMSRPRSNHGVRTLGVGPHGQLRVTGRHVLAAVACRSGGLFLHVAAGGLLNRRKLGVA
jgi:hypothetical protein